MIQKSNSETSHIVWSLYRSSLSLKFEKQIDDFKLIKEAIESRLFHGAAVGNARFSSIFGCSLFVRKAILISTFDVSQYYRFAESDSLSQLQRFSLSLKILRSFLIEFLERKNCKNLQVKTCKTVKWKFIKKTFCGLSIKSLRDYRPVKGMSLGSIGFCQKFQYKTLF